jgi:hypothetical protein
LPTAVKTDSRQKAATVSSFTVPTTPTLSSSVSTPSPRCLALLRLPSSSSLFPRHPRVEDLLGLGSKGSALLELVGLGLELGGFLKRTVSQMSGVVEVTKQLFAVSKVGILGRVCWDLGWQFVLNLVLVTHPRVEDLLGLGSKGSALLELVGLGLELGESPKVLQQILQQSVADVERELSTLWPWHRM